MAQRKKQTVGCGELGLLPFMLLFEREDTSTIYRDFTVSILGLDVSIGTNWENRGGKALTNGTAWDILALANTVAP